MATFEAQVEALTSISITTSGAGDTSPNSEEVTQFLIDGVNDVIVRHTTIRPQDRHLFVTESSESSSQDGLTTNSGKIVSVVRESGTADDWRECRAITIGMQNRVQDVNSLHYASTYNPAFFINADGKVSVYPTPGNAPNSAYKLYFISSDPKDDEGRSLTYAYSTIKNFPDNKVYLVVMYASIKSLENAMGALHGDSNVNTALTAVNTELDELPAIADQVGGQVDIAVTEAAEIATLTDNSGTINTAVAAMATELNKVDNIIDLANDEFDEVAVEISATATSPISLARGEFDEARNLSGTYNSGSIATALGLIKTAVDQAATAADKFESATESIFGDEETFLTDRSQLTRVKDALDNAEKIIDDGANSPTGDAAGDAATYLLTEEDIELVQASVGIATSEIQRAQAHLAEWSSIGDMRVKQVQAAVSEAQGYANEVETYLKAMTAYQSTGSAYLQEAQARIAGGNAFLAEAQSRIAQAQGYAGEVQARGKFTEAKMMAVSSAINTASGYVSEMQSKIGIAQGYIGEAQSRMAELEQRYQWYTQRHKSLREEYDQAFAIQMPPQQQQQQVARRR